jgi:SulP family sulfate permease
MSRISTMDATGARILDEAIKHLEHRGITVLISGITPAHHDLLDTLSVARTLRAQDHVFPNTPAAIAYARTILSGGRSAQMVRWPEGAGSEPATFKL